MSITASTVAKTLPIEIQKIKRSRLHDIDLSKVGFGSVFTDHLYYADYADGAWQQARIVPYELLSMSPALSGLHYGQSIFEGMKAFRNKNGEVHVFRPEAHLNRFNTSAGRLCMPPVPLELFLDALETFIRLDADWVPAYPGSLYVRPLLYATDEYLGMRPSNTYRLLILGCPVNIYYSQPLKVYVTTDYIRASPDGIGYVKAAGNYARALLPNKEAQERGYNVVLWLDAINRRYVEEFSTMNAFFVIDDFVVTPRLTGTFLDGITRDTVIKLCREEGLAVYERDIAIEEIISMNESGNLKEAFGTGTAAVMAPVESFTYKNITMTLPLISEWKIMPTILKKITDLRNNHIPDTYQWMYKI